MGSSFKSMLLTSILVIYFSDYTEGELKLVNVVFRHGDRAPDNNGLEMYPKDPYINSTFDPMGLGGLTNNGKRREYSLGLHLRKIYGNFLGDTYYPAEVSCRSTNVDRTKMSLQLVLASLYRPKNKQKWLHDLDWQPIPANYVPGLDDNLMVPEECPKYLKAREKVEQLPEVKAKLGKLEPLMRFLTNVTGKTIADSNDMYFLYHALMAEKSMKLTLPAWTEKIFPYGQLLDGINLEYAIFSYTTEMRKLNGGMLLRKFIDDMIAYRNGSLSNRQKLFLYSGHETNVAAVLQALGLYKPHVPEYSSAVFLELHEENFNYYVKVKYYKGIPNVNEAPHEEMTVSGCSENCSLDDFIASLQDVIPSDEDTKCDKRSLRHALENNEIKVAPGIIKQIIDSLNKEKKIGNSLH